MIKYLLFILISANSAFAEDRAAEVHRLAQDPRWLALLDMRTAHVFIGMRSQVVGHDFFFSPRGNVDPEAELRATVEAFESDQESLAVESPNQQQLAQCAFPARYELLKQELHLEISDQRCPEFESFLKHFQARRLALVFSTAFPNNPGSMFGHTFLRLISDTRPPMLDDSLSFAASVPRDGDPLFAIKGIFGFYRGLFTVAPYYAKINEYNNSESRDLIEYELTLNAAETLRLIRHVWELEKNAWLDYYFVDENCASLLLHLLEVARPGLKIRRQPDYLTPGESVREVVNTPGLVKSISTRPSLRRRLQGALAPLDHIQKEQVKKAAAGLLPASDIADFRVLDATDLYFQFLKQQRSGVLDAQTTALARGYLIRRAELNAVEPSAMQTLEVPRPEEAHLPHRVTAAYGVLDGNGFFELEARLALHDLMDDDRGYVARSVLEFPSIALRVDGPSGAWSIDHANLLHVMSLFPITWFDRQPSWNIVIDERSIRDVCGTCHAGHVEAGLGVAGEPLGKTVLVDALLSLYADVSGSLARDYRYGPKVSAAILWSPVEAYKLRVGGDLVGDALQNDRPSSFTELSVEQSYAFSQRWSLRVIGDQILSGEPGQARVQQLKLGLSSYF